MQFLSIRDFSKAPKTALNKLSLDGKAVLTNNGKPAAIMITVNAESFEHIFSLVQEVERRSCSQIHHLSTNNKEQVNAFERLMKFSRKKPHGGFDYKKELIEAIDERYGSID